MNIFGKTIGIAVLGIASVNAHAIPIGGVEFPDGAMSFADAVVSYSPGPDVGAGYNVASGALGIPDYSGANNTSTSLGEGGSLTLQFTDNSLTTSGDATEDLWIFEIGGAIESFNTQISVDGISWIDLGDISGQPSGYDIDSVAGVVAGALFSFVRLTDVAPNQSGSPFGEADIDAVGAISSAPPVVIIPPAGVPEPGTLGLLGLACLGLGLARRKQPA